MSEVIAPEQNKPGLARRVAYNTVVQFAGRIGGAIIAILSTRLIAEALGVAGYGRYTSIFAYITFFGAIADFGFFWYLVREVARDKKNAEETTANVLTLRLIFALGVLILGAIIAFSIPRYDSEVRLGIVLLAASMLWTTLSNTLIGIFQAHERMDYPVVNEIIGRLVTLALTWYAVSQGMGLMAIVYSALTGGFIIFILNFVFARRYVKIRFGFDTHLWKGIMRENMTLGINVLLGIIYFKIDAVILSAMKPSFDVGIYGSAYKVLEILLAFPAIFMGTVFPSLARVIQTDAAKTKLILQKAFDLLSIALWGVVAGLFVLAKPIIIFTTKGGQDFLSAHTVSIGSLALTAPVILQILSIAVGMAFLGNFFVSTIVAQGSQKKLIIANLINAAVNVAGNIILIPYYSYLAAAGMTIASEVIMLVFSAVIIYQTIKFLPKLAVFWKAGVCALLMGCALLFIRDSVSVIVSTVLGGLLYVGLLIMSGCLNQEMIALILRKEKL
jgi:O-antigen/teichoic acid export membrane protein